MFTFLTNVYFEEYFLFYDGSKRCNNNVFNLWSYRCFVFEYILRQTIAWVQILSNSKCSISLSGIPQ